MDVESRLKTTQRVMMVVAEDEAKSGNRDLGMRRLRKSRDGPGCGGKSGREDTTCQMDRDGISMGEEESATGSGVGSERPAMFARLVVGRWKMQMQREREFAWRWIPNVVTQLTLTHTHSILQTWTSPSRDGHGWFQVAGADGGSGRERLRSDLQSVTSQPVAGEGSRGTNQPWKDVPAKATH